MQRVHQLYSPVLSLFCPNPYPFLSLFSSLFALLTPRGSASTLMQSRHSGVQQCSTIVCGVLSQHFQQPNCSILLKYHVKYCFMNAEQTCQLLYSNLPAASLNKICILSSTHTIIMTTATSCHSPQNEHQ